jgi:membrane-associated phospholipid phosphatase
VSDRSRFASWVSDDEGRLRGRPHGAVLAVAYVVFSATYLPINFFSVGRDAATLFLPGEEQIPFLPIWEYFYVLSYFVGPLLFFTVRDWTTLSRLLRATAAALLVAYATYLVFPVYFERPHLEVDSLHTWLLSIEYLDKPYNHFPSLHVTLSWLAVFASQVRRPARVALVLTAIGISVSTIFVKQHYIVDVIYGFALATATWWLCGRSLAASRRMASRPNLVAD